MNDPKGTTFWDFILIAFAWLEARTTRILGLASGTMAILASSDVVPKEHLPYYMAGIAVLTFWRGQSTAKVVADAQAVVAKSKDPTIVPFPDKLSGPSKSLGD
jgi:hypothetical protein